MNDDDTPYVEQPDELDDDSEKNGLMCFMDMDRPCSADCMAFSTFPAESPYLGEQQKNCTVLVGVERLGRFMGGALSVMKKGNADAKREAAKPQSPMGGS